MSPWSATDPALADVLVDLRAREPIFHTGLGLADIELQLPPDYWETGASGSRYSRAFVLDVLRERAALGERAGLGERAAHPSEDRWETSEFACRAVGPDTYLLTYTLRQVDRLTRRLTVWRRAHGEWQILYHQGTVVSP